jgi:hypothetical protein
VVVFEPALVEELGREARNLMQLSEREAEEADAVVVLIVRREARLDPQQLGPRDRCWETGDAQAERCEQAEEPQSAVHSDLTDGSDARARRAAAEEWGVGSRGGGGVAAAGAPRKRQVFRVLSV